MKKAFVFALSLLISIAASSQANAAGKVCVNGRFKLMGQNGTFASMAYAIRTNEKGLSHFTSKILNPEDPLGDTNEKVKDVVHADSVDLVDAGVNCMYCVALTTSDQQIYVEFERLSDDGSVNAKLGYFNVRVQDVTAKLCAE